MFNTAVATEADKVRTSWAIYPTLLCCVYTLSPRPSLQQCPKQNQCGRGLTVEARSKVLTATTLVGSEVLVFPPLNKFSKKLFPLILKKTTKNGLAECFSACCNSSFKACMKMKAAPSWLLLGGSHKSLKFGVLISTLALFYCFKDQYI